ncbi:MAG: ATP-binding protein, partial [Gemmatimonadales bacterium]
VAHEVNNQMTAVLGFGEFVLRALGPDHPQAPDQRQVLLAADRAARVTQQLLAFTRQQINQPRVIELGELADRLRPVLQQLLGSDKELEITPTRPRRRVNADPMHVEQVLINLVANARDATGTDGRVTISVEDAEVSEAPVAGQSSSMAPGPYVVLTVADSGTGIDADTIARIFEPFFTTKPVGQGTGLGLSMVYGIVKQHGGYIWAQSHPGQGTAMRLYWPAVPSLQTPGLEAPDGETVSEVSRPQKATTILVVEDEPAVRQLAVRSLESAGFTVLEAADGKAALDVIHAGQRVPDLLLTDAVMPRLGGRELGETAAALEPDLPVLFISGYAGDDVVLRRLVPEGAAFLQKPFTPTQLVRSVTRLLARRERRADGKRSAS